MEKLKVLGSLFYVVNPYETMFEKVSDIPTPDLIAKALPFLFGMILLEQVVLKLQGKKGIRLNDGLISIANGLIRVMRQMLTKGVLMWAYYYIYENWKIYELPWDSLFTWIAAALLTDLGYYWVHRAAHGNYKNLIIWCLTRALCVCLFV